MHYIGGDTMGEAVSIISCISLVITALFAVLRFMQEK